MSQEAIDVHTLSKDAKLILFGYFANPRTRLTVHTDTVKLTAGAQAAFDEMLEAGILQREIEGAAHVWKLTEIGFATQKEATRNPKEIYLFISANAYWKLTEPRDAPAAARLDM